MTLRAALTHAARTSGHIADPLRVPGTNIYLAPQLVGVVDRRLHTAPRCMQSPLACPACKARITVWMDRIHRTVQPEVVCHHCGTVNTTTQIEGAWK